MIRSASRVVQGSNKILHRNYLGSRSPGKWSFCFNVDTKCDSGFSSVQFSCSVVSNSLWPHGLQHARLPCPSPTPGAYSNSCPSSWWCHPTVSSSVVPVNLSQHQGLFQWVSSLHQVAKGLALNVLCCAVLSHSVMSDSLVPHGL